MWATATTPSSTTASSTARISSTTSDGDAGDGGQDRLNLDGLFGHADLGPAPRRTVSLSRHAAGGVDARGRDGKAANGFELVVATLNLARSRPRSSLLAKTFSSAADCAVELGLLR
jgi:hypothetical protein